MNAVVLLACVVLPPTLCQQQTQEQKLLGKWEVIRKIGSGNDFTRGDLKTHVMSFLEDGKVVISSYGDSARSPDKADTYRTDGSRTPCHIDIDVHHERFVGFDPINMKGIFKFRHELLIMFFHTGTGKIERPKEFGDGSKDGEVLMVLKRIKD